MRRAILNALRAKYEAEIAEADATANIYLDNSVGIGEHPQHVEECNKLIDKIANAKEKLEVLKEFYYGNNEKIEEQTWKNIQCANQIQVGNIFKILSISVSVFFANFFELVTKTAGEL